MRALGAVALLALLLGFAPAPVTQAADPVQIRVAITDGGFNGNPGDFTVEVEQGALVELTFIWDHKAYIHEEHIMVLEGYRLEKDKITATNRETTLRLVADKPGTFVFKCDLDCEIHDFLQRGHLKVKRSGEGGGAAALPPTTLSLSPSAWEASATPILLTAVLKDAKSGNPVAKAEIRFFLDAEFAGTQGQMPLGKAKTDASGTASLEFRPTLPAPKQNITARFEGMGLYDESQQAIEIEVGREPASAYVMEPIGLEPDLPSLLFLSAAPAGPLSRAVAWFQQEGIHVSFVAIVLAVWSALGFVLYQAIAMRRVRPVQQQEVIREKAPTQ